MAGSPLSRPDGIQTATGRLRFMALTTQGMDSSKFLKVRRDLDSLLYDIALLCHAAYVEQGQTGEIADLFRNISEAHERLQTAKSDDAMTPQDLKQLRQYRREETLTMVRKVRHRGKYLNLPPDIQKDLKRYDKLSKYLRKLIRKSSWTEHSLEDDIQVIGTPAAGSKTKPKLDPSSGEAEDGDSNLEADSDENCKDVEISGLDTVPDIGAPLKFLSLSPPPPSIAVWVRTRLDNADLWFTQNRVLATRLVRVFVVSLICINLLAFHWFMMSANNAEVESSAAALQSEPIHDSESAASLAPMGKAPIRDMFGLLAPVLIILGSLFAAWVCWDEKPNRYIESFNLEKVKQTLIPFDPVNTPIQAFWPSFWAGDAPTKAAVRERDQSLGVAQFMSIGMLVLVLVYPFAQSKALALTVPDQQMASPTGNAEWQDELNPIADDAAALDEEQPTSAPRDRLRGKYLWMTGILALLAGLGVLTMWLRQASTIGRDGATFFGIRPTFPTDVVDGPTLVDVENPEGKSLSGEVEPEVDHEDPYGAMARSISAKTPDALLGRSLLIGVMIARYRFLNRWRIFSVIAYVIQHSFRFVGVIVFAGMLLISLVMPMVFLSAVQNQAKNEYIAFRALADPFLGDELEADDRELLDGHSEQGVRPGENPLQIEAIDNKGTQAVVAQRRSRASLYYVIAVLAMVLINVALAVARILYRGKNRHVVHLAVEKGDLRMKATIAGLLMMLALFSWSDNMHIGKPTIDLENLHADDSRVVSTVRAVRQKAHLEQKMITATLAPPVQSHSVWFVDAKHGSNENDGRSWDRAYQSLQFAIDAAAETGGGEVWVAEGQYGVSDWSSDRSPDSTKRMLTIPGNVRVFGGFAGNSVLFPEVQRNERNWVDRETVLFTSVPSQSGVEEGVVLLQNGAMLDGFAFCSTEAYSTGGFLSANSPEPGDRYSVIGNSRLIFAHHRRRVPSHSLGGSTLIHSSQFADTLGTTAPQNMYVSIAPNLFVMPHPRAIDPNGSPKGN